MDYFAISLAVLFALAVIDLSVGVSNDAVNFLNSAIGSQVATRRVIMIVVCCGVVVGAIFSSGIMQVARSGIINPELFTFADVMVVFLAVMLADVLLTRLCCFYTQLEEKAVRSVSIRWLMFKMVTDMQSSLQRADLTLILIGITT